MENVANENRTVVKIRFYRQRFWRFVIKITHYHYCSDIVFLRWIVKYFKTLKRYLLAC